MSLTLTLEAANAYFGDENHVQHSVWSGFAEKQRTAALAQATRQISRMIETDVTAEEVDAERYYHPDRAVFEQALWLLTQSRAVPNGEQVAPHWSGSDGEAATTAEGDPPPRIHPEAMAYIGGRPIMIVTTRG